MDTILLKTKLKSLNISIVTGIASLGRTSNGIEIGSELSSSDTFLQSSEPGSPDYEEPAGYFSPPASNNNFMRRNVKVKEWSSFLQDEGQCLAEK